MARDTNKIKIKQSRQINTRNFDEMEVNLLLLNEKKQTNMEDNSLYQDQGVRVVGGAQIDVINRITSFQNEEI